MLFCLIFTRYKKYHIIQLDTDDIYAAFLIVTPNYHAWGLVKTTPLHHTKPKKIIPVLLDLTDIHIHWTCQKL